MLSCVEACQVIVEDFSMLTCCALFFQWQNGEFYIFYHRLQSKLFAVCPGKLRHSSFSFPCESVTRFYFSPECVGSRFSELCGDILQDYLSVLQNGQECV